MLLTLYVHAFYFIITIGTVFPRSLDLSKLTPLFFSCWTEVTILNGRICDRNWEVGYQLDFPHLLTLLNFNGSHSSPYATLHAVQHIQLKTNCFVILLLHSCTDWEVTSTVSAALKIWARYNGLNNDLYWYETVFKIDKSFVLIYFQGADDLAKTNQLVSELQETCHCTTIQARLNGNKFELAVQKTIESYGRLHSGKRIYANLTTTSSVTIHSIRAALMSSFSSHFINKTKSWRVFIRYDYGVGDTCIYSAPNPAVLLQYKDIQAQDRHFLYLLVNFLSSGKYKVVLARTHPVERRGKSSSGDISCIAKNSELLQVNTMFIYMKDHSLLSSNPYANLIRTIQPHVVTLFTSIHLKEYNFITCDGRKQKTTSFEIYIKSMDKTVWFSLLIMLGVVASLGFGFVHKLNLPDSPWMIVVGLILEVSPHVTRGLQRRRQYSMILVPLLITSMILTNGYRGILTADLTAVPPWMGLENFDDILKSGFTILGDIGATFHNTLNILFCPAFNDTTLSKGYEELRDTYSDLLVDLASGRINSTPERHRKFEEIRKAIKVLGIVPVNCSIRGSVRRYIDAPGARHPNDLIFPELTKCKRTVYAIPSEEIYPRLALSNSNTTIPIYHGRQEPMLKLGSQYYAVVTKEAEFDSLYIRRNIEALATGGFLFYWEFLKMWPFKRKYDRAESIFQDKMTQPIPLTLVTKCSTVFVIFLVGILSSLVAFWGEQQFGRK